MTDLPYVYAALVFLLAGLAAVVVHSRDGGSVSAPQGSRPRSSRWSRPMRACPTS